MEIINITNGSLHQADNIEHHSISEEKWKKLLGSNNWEGLIEPDFDIDLRKFILRCGDLCHAAYDAFIKGQDAKDVKMPNDLYQAHAPLYAATRLNFVEKVLHIPAKLKAKISPPAEGDHVPNWMGYCASTTDEVSRAIGRREIYIAWRGTKRLFEWKNNIIFKKHEAYCLLHNSDTKYKTNPEIARGWLSIYTSTDQASSSYVKTSARDQVKDNVAKLLEKYKDEKISIVITGHSLGGILAILSAFDLVENSHVTKEIPVVAVVFSCPKIGDEAFKEKVELHPNLKILHVKDRKDIVPRLPAPGFVSVGKELVVDARAKSPRWEIRHSRSRSVFHELETVLQMVTGWNGPDKPFEQQVKRSTHRLMENTKALRYVGVEIKTWFRSVKDITKHLLQPNKNLHLLSFWRSTKLYLN